MAQTYTPVVLPFAHPLDEFYAHAGMRLPRIELLEGARVPEPYRQLLVHDGDMTPTLEKFHRSSIHLEVLKREQRGDFYFRQVVLLTDEDERPVEFGAIKIYLELFPSQAQSDIRAERLPLGTILAKYKIPHESRPKAFVQVTPDDYIRGALRLGASAPLLYGRRNTLSTPQQHVLAEIFEILPTEPQAKVTA